MSYPPHGLTAETLGLDGTIPNVQSGIDRAVAYVRRVAGWHVFPLVEDTIVVDGEGGHVLTLPTLHVTDLSEITEHGTVLHPDTYEWSATGDVKRLGRCWTTRWRGITVTLTHGYDTADAAVLDLGSALADAVTYQASSPLGIPEVIGPYQFGGESSGWTGDAATTLSRFVLPPRA
ncbi:head-to-tail adaptor [Gordonia phage Upyo]|nr:head-to-tail adaptor [Gordonia phage Upyo]